MRTRPVHWYEGMLVLPHHFQAADQFHLEWLASQTDWLSPYAYGIAEIEFQEEALSNFEVRIPRLRARLKDGTLLSVPENAFLDKVDLRPVFEENREVYLHLAVPQVTPGKANATRVAHNGERRLLVVGEEWEDRNDGGNPRTIETQRYNAQLLVLSSTESPKGYESVPIAKLQRSERENAVPEISDDYIPPLLNCSCWSGLTDRILLSITAQLGSFIKSQAEYLRTHGGWSEANQPQIRRAINKLQAVNTAYPVLVQLVEGRGVSPFQMYGECCRLLGQLSLFRDDWQAPELPLYDHEDLGRIFRAIQLELNAVLKGEGPSQQVQRFPFLGVQQWMEVALDPNWFGGGRKFFVGVRSDLPPERLELLFSERWLDWKLGSTRTILQIYRNAEAGLRLTRVPGVHPALPALQGVTYFEIDPTGPYWEQVEETRNLALKVNDKYIRGSFIGQNTMTVVDPRNHPRDLTLELFVVEQ